MIKRQGRDTQKVEEVSKNAFKIFYRLFKRNWKYGKNALRNMTDFLREIGSMEKTYFKNIDATK